MSSGINEEKFQKLRDIALNMCIHAIEATTEAKSG